MKIAVVTFWDSKDNYGQVMQAYALCKYLAKYGHTSYLVRYKYREPHNLKYWLKFLYCFAIEILKLLKRPSVYLKKRHLINKELSHNRDFDVFRGKYIPLTERTYNQYDLKTNPPEADIYISGSDQIWSLLDPVYFLQFVPKDKKCLAYGSSCGGRVYNDNDKKILKHYLERYAFIGLRENRDVFQVKKLGFRQATTVVDPTLLLSVEDYDHIAQKNQCNEKYILLYLIGNKYEFDKKEVFDFAAQNNLQVKYVASQGCYDELEKIYPTPQEWLGLIKKASYVVTNSFHGTVFSIIYHRKFMVIPLNGTSYRMNARIVDLLEPLGLMDRIYEKSLKSLHDVIGYDHISNVINNYKKTSIMKFNQHLD